MKPAKQLIVASLVVGIVGLIGFASNASAQPGHQPRSYEPPVEPMPAYSAAPYRFGLTLSVDLGLGSMSSDSDEIRCDGCDVEPVAVSASFEIGAMLNPRLALLVHLRATGRSLDVDGVNILWNSMGLIAAKYWLNRQLWVKGGLGFATLGITYDDGFVTEDTQLDEGGAGLLAIGYEVLHSRRFALDLSLTATSSTFSQVEDTINTGVISLGASWF